MLNPGKITEPPTKLALVGVDVENKKRVISRFDICQALIREGVTAKLGYKGDVFIDAPDSVVTVSQAKEWSTKLQSRVMRLCEGEWLCSPVTTGSRYLINDNGLCRRCAKPLEMKNYNPCGECKGCKGRRQTEKRCRRSCDCKPQLKKASTTMMIGALGVMTSAEVIKHRNEVYRFALMQILMARRRNETVFAVLHLDVTLLILNAVGVGRIRRIVVPFHEAVMQR